MSAARVPLTLVEFDDSALLDRTQSQSQANMLNGNASAKKPEDTHSTAAAEREPGATRERSLSQYELRVMKSLEKLSVPHSLIEQAREKMTMQRSATSTRDRHDYSVVQSMENLAAFSFSRPTELDTSKTNGNHATMSNGSTTPSSTSAQQRSVIVRMQPAYRSLTNLHPTATFSFLNEQKKAEPVRVELPSAKFRQRSEKLGPIQSSLPKSFEEFKKSMPNLAVLSSANAAPSETVVRSTAASLNSAPPKSILKRPTENDTLQDAASTPITLLKLSANDFRSRKTDKTDYAGTGVAQSDADAEARKKAEQEERLKRLAAREVDKVATCKPPPVPTLPIMPSESKSAAAPSLVDGTLSRPTGDNVCSFVRRKVYELTRLITLCDRTAVSLGEALRRFTLDNCTDEERLAADGAALNNALNSALKRSVESTANSLYAAIDPTATLRYVTAREDAFFPRCEAFLSKFTSHTDAMRVASRVARTGATLFGNGIVLFLFARLADVDAYLNDTRAYAADADGVPFRAFVTYATVRDVRQQFVSCAGIGVRTLADLACLYNPATHFVLACALYATEMPDGRRSRLGAADAQSFIDAACKWQCVDLHDAVRADNAPRLASPRAASPKTVRHSNSNRESTELQLGPPARAQHTQTLVDHTYENVVFTNSNQRASASASASGQTSSKPLIKLTAGAQDAANSSPQSEEERRRIRESRFVKVQRALRAYGVNLRDVEPRVHAALIDYVEGNQRCADQRFTFTVQDASGDKATYSCVISVTADDPEPVITRLGNEVQMRESAATSASTGAAHLSLNIAPPATQTQTRDMAAAQRASLPLGTQNGAAAAGRSVRSTKITEL